MTREQRKQATMRTRLWFAAIVQNAEPLTPMHFDDLTAHRAAANCKANRKDGASMTRKLDILKGRRARLRDSGSDAAGQSAGEHEEGAGEEHGEGAAPERPASGLLAAHVRTS